MLHFLLVAFLCFAWGASWVAIRMGLQDAPPFLSAAYRFILASLVLAALSLPRLRRQRFSPGEWKWIAISGITMYPISYGVVYYAEQYITGGMAAIIFGTFPFWVALFAHWWLPGERLNVLVVLGLVLGFFGIVVVFGGQSVGRNVLWAMAVMLLSPLSAALASIILKKHLARPGLDPLVVTMWQTIVGTTLIAGWAFWVERAEPFVWTPNTIGVTVFLGVFSTALAFAVYLYLLHHETATRLALIAFVTPIVAVICGWIALQETLEPVVFVGGALVLLGITCVNVLAPRRQRARDTDRVATAPKDRSGVHR